ncbi:MAG: hypothetical protein COA58_02675 [Bacteroidetes bacterium]|nr:MAG: hypothetical protein COA58_02675 [Bacteroidota bacterium]
MTPEEKKALLPYSSGRLAEVIVVTDSKSLDSSFKEDIKRVFHKRIKGHPPPGEPMFKVLFTDESFFKGYFKNHHNIFILLHENRANRLKEIIGEVTVDRMVNRLKTEPQTFGVKQEDVYAQNQSIFWVLASNKEAMQQKLLDYDEELLQLAYKHETHSAKFKLIGDISVKRDRFYQKSIKTRGFGVRKPKAYKVAIDNDEFVWLRKSSTTQELEQGLLLYEAPYRTKEDLSTDSLIKFRNRLVKKYIPGELKGSYMKYSTMMPPVRTDENFKGKYGVEIRGWWDVEGDFMGGPSYIKAVVDEANGRIVFAEGFLFFPNEEKAVHLRELEVLVNTLSIK